MTINGALRRIGGITAAGALALGALVVGAGPATAETNPYCSSGVTKIGTTGYVTLNGQTAASVKQFKGCGKNWAYTFVWESFRNSYPDYRACSSIVVGSTLQDLRCGSTSATWSSGASTLSSCTFAAGSVTVGSRSADARTDTRC